MTWLASRRLAVLLCCGIVSMVAAGASTFAQRAANDEFAQRQLDSGLAFLRDGKYSEALKDFQSVVDTYPASAAADDALLEIARYQFDRARDLAAAEAAVETLLKKYASGDAAPMGHILAGRITLARARTAADLDAALASFERVPRLFPGTESVAAALYYAGDALRLARRTDEALYRFEQVASEFPRTTWAARAWLGLGMCLVGAGKPAAAMDALQHVRARFAGSPEAARALALNTIVYRLFVRSPLQQPFAPAAGSLVDATGRLRDVVAIEADAQDRIYVATKAAVMSFEAGGGPAHPLQIAATTIRALMRDRTGKVVVVHRGGLQAEGASAVGVGVPKNDGSTRLLDDIPAAVELSNGERLVADKDTKTIQRFGPDGKHIGLFAQVNTTRLAVNSFDEVAALDRDTKSVALFDRGGRPVGRVPARGTGYELSGPVDLAFDALGHLYVLDRERSSVFVFAAPQVKLTAAFTLPENAPGAFRSASALAIDSAGRLYIHDDRAQRVQVYQ